MPIQVTQHPGRGETLKVWRGTGALVERSWVTEFRTRTERYDPRVRLSTRLWPVAMRCAFVVGTFYSNSIVQLHVQARSDDIELNSICYSFVWFDYDYLFPTKTQRSLRFCPTYQYQPAEFCVLMVLWLMDGCSTVGIWCLLFNVQLW